MHKEINFYRPRADFPRKISMENIRNNCFQAEMQKEEMKKSTDWNAHVTLLKENKSKEEEN